MTNTGHNGSTVYDKAAAYLYSLLSMILGIMVCVFALFTFFFRLVSVSGDSMNPNIYHGQKIIVSNVMYRPDYGDIVAIGRSTPTENSIIKRVIGLPGDRIDINFDTHIVVVNDSVITEHYKTQEAISDPGDVSFPLTVPEDCVFVLGDNRNNSLDSRYSSVGFIRLDEITGKALFRLFPPGPLY
ncbi:MAG: signal peptidase I [Clostridia bacterium]|nr:signal peptidase I [Clostridia bacterium]